MSGDGALPCCFLEGGDNPTFDVMVEVMRQQMRPGLAEGRAVKWGGGLRAAVGLLCLVVFIGVRGAAGQSTTPATQPAGATASGAADLLLKMATSEGAERAKLLTQLAQTGDARLDAALTDFSQGSLYVYQGKLVTEGKVETVDDRKVAPLSDPLTRQPVTAGGAALKVPVAELKEVSISRRERGLVRDAQMLLKLSDPDPAQRENAVVKIGESGADASLPILQTMAGTETNTRVKRVIDESMALIQIGQPGTTSEALAARAAAAQRLGELRSSRSLSKLTDLLKAEPDPGVKKALTGAIARINSWQRVVDWVGIAFSGLSTSSILVLMALGLAITFGLMGVINMAHGELMMIGAYATYLTQEFFTAHFSPAAFDAYFLVAIPVSFLAAAAVGMIMEATVIRFLYGRPLDTLLATLGISALLIQLVRVNFGDNRAVNAPRWLQGSFEIMQDVNLPYNRLFIIGFCVVCILLMYGLIEKTRMGLLLRATTQNRQMAASLGMSTRKIDLLTFGLGSGLAGMAGCALTQVGGITPNMGQNYIVDSFLVVVTGGVGKLAGAIWSGLGIGTLNKFMEPYFGTVWAKVLILILVVAFIQRRPSGLFPAKGRLADV